MDVDIDWVLPGAAPRAARGPRRVGVRTRAVAYQTSIGVDRVTRELDVEVWYPTSQSEEIAKYPDRLPSRDERYQIVGRASRDAEPDGRHPLVVVAHGNTGSRFLLAWLSEHLASYGFTVAAIDHRGARHGDTGSFADVMYNHPRDIEAVVSQSASWPERAGDDVSLVGYSMGGYGVLQAAGAGVREEAVRDERASPGGRLADRAEGVWKPLIRPEAVVAIAPFGNPALFTAAAMAGLGTRLLVFAATADEISGYSPGAVELCRWATGCDRALVTLHGAGHSIGAHPSPTTAADDYPHYGDLVWDQRRVCDVIRHAVVSWLAEGDVGPGLDGRPAVDVERSAPEAR